MYLKFDKNSVKIFKYLFNTEKNINLYCICGSDDEKIDKVLEAQAPYTQFDPMHNVALPHNTCDNYLKGLTPDYITSYDFHDGNRVDKVGTLVFYYPETGMNIREQQKFVNELIKKVLEFTIDQNDFNIIIVTNSLWILSDIPSGNVNVFNTEICKSSENIFFGGNIIDILANFSPDIMTGRLSSDYASKLIELANDFEERKSTEKPDVELVDFIGDKIIKGYIKRQTSLF